MSGDWWKVLFIRFTSRRTGGALCVKISHKQQARCRKTEKLIRNCLNKNINDIIPLVYISFDANSDRYFTSASGSEISATSAAPINIECDEKPAKKQKLSSKEFEGEETIMDN